MSSGEFTIEFSYEDVAYVGLVKPKNSNGETWYTVDLESDNQESYLQITLKPSNSEIDDWDFIVADDDADGSYHYDKDLLTEVGEAIERYQLKGWDADNRTMA